MRPRPSQPSRGRHVHTCWKRRERGTEVSFAMGRMRARVPEECKTGQARIKRTQGPYVQMRCVESKVHTPHPSLQHTPNSLLLLQNMWDNTRRKQVGKVFYERQCLAR